MSESIAGTWKADQAQRIQAPSVLPPQPESDDASGGFELSTAFEHLRAVSKYVLKKAILHGEQLTEDETLAFIGAVVISNSVVREGPLS